jgi:hypothetical protein
MKKGRTPFNPMHFKPTSRMSSAVSTDCVLSFDDDVSRLYNSVNDSGEFIVIVAAVYICQFWFLKCFTEGLTDNVSHAGAPMFLADASSLSCLYTDLIRGVAGSVLGLAKGALMRAFSDDDSFDMITSFQIFGTNRKWQMVLPPLNTNQSYINCPIDLILKISIFTSTAGKSPSG